jgi:assimilatory nitrate reductase catalytic subunit
VTTTCTTCPYCGVGCGLKVSVTEGRGIEVTGDAGHPANRGRLCSKSAALGETVGLEGRLLTPRIGRRAVDWNEALDAVAAGLAGTIAQHGPDAVAFYVSGQLLTEDYYVANKLMKGFIGSANIDTNSRLCMSSAVAGHKRAFGADIVPGCYEDLEEADLVVLVGANSAWCHPVLYQRIIAARTAGKCLVVIDPRRTATCDEADLHLPLKPGTDVRLMNGLFNHLLRDGRIDGQATAGLGDVIAVLDGQDQSIAAVATDCGLDEKAVARFYDLFSRTEKVVTLFSQGVNQSAGGTDKVNAIINCHLLTGRIGKPGMGPFSLTGQPNAMGGREVGGLANQLAAHMDFEPEAISRVGRFWDAPRMATRPGLKAVEMVDAMLDGRLKAIWIMGTNPAVSLPDGARVREALRTCPLVIVSDCMEVTDTTVLAHILLPASAWGEKDGTVTNSERRISRQRGFLAPPGAARADWRIISDVARRMGFGQAFPYEKPADLFREHAALSGFENEGARAFDISGLAAITDAAYDTLKPVQWPVPPGRPEGTPRMPRRRYTMVGVMAPPAFASTLPQYPLVLNTGRIRDQWHSMTRTGLSPRLASHLAEPFVEVHPDDARTFRLEDGGLARLGNTRGKALLRVHVTQRQRKGMLFAPIHWSDNNAASALACRLIGAVCDPISGQPAFKQTAVAIAPYRPVWSGFLFSRDRDAGALLRRKRVDYWVRITIGQGYAYELADRTLGSAQSVFASLADAATGAEVIDFHDPHRARHRWAALQGPTLTHCLMMAPPGALPARDQFAGLLNEQYSDVNKRLMLLSGCTNTPEGDNGPLVCSCFGVSLGAIVDAITGGGARSVEEIGALLKAGTNCGSCRPELKSILDSEMEEVAA